MDDLLNDKKKKPISKPLGDHCYKPPNTSNVSNMCLSDDT